MNAHDDGLVNDATATARLGSAIRDARRGRYTLQQLAEESGVSLGLISQLERGIGNPSFRTLQRLAGALDLRIGDLAEAASGDGKEPMIVRHHERARLQVSAEAPIYELLTPNLKGHLEVLETTLPPGFSNRQQKFQHIGEECVVVQSGIVEVGVGDLVDTLAAGDAITYDSSIPHWWENNSSDPARVLGVVTPPSF